jgi:curved DNA-binding protein CbpA
MQMRSPVTEKSTPISCEVQAYAEAFPIIVSSSGLILMARIHTHYDNLKVARNAPPEVIRAAYKTLSQKYHPDRNPGNSDAIRIIQIINLAYEVLSDPVKRREHDEWIARTEAAQNQKTTGGGKMGSQESRRTAQANSSQNARRSASPSVHRSRPKSGSRPFEKVRMMW